MKFERLTAKQILERLPELKGFFQEHDISGNKKLTLVLQVGGKVEIRPTLYDYTVRDIFVKRGNIEREKYAGSSDNPQDVLAHSGAELPELPPDGLIAVLDNHGNRSLWLAVYLGVSIPLPSTQS